MQGHAGSKTLHQQNPPVLKWRCRLMHVDLYNVYMYIRSKYRMPSVLWHCWLGGRKGIWPAENWVVGCWCHCHSLSLASVKSRLVLPFWCQLTQVVPDEKPLNGCACVCVCVCVCVCEVSTKRNQNKHANGLWFGMPLKTMMLTNVSHFCAGDKPYKCDILKARTIVPTLNIL